MPRFFAWLGPLFRRRRRWLIVLGTCAVLLAGASPFLWAGYHWYAVQAALKRYHNAEAREHLNVCLKIWPWSRSARVHLLAARVARRDGDFPKAAHHLHECQDTLGDVSPESALEWAMLHAASGDLGAVEKHLKTLARKDPDQAPLILEALIEGYQRMSRFFDARRCVDVWLTHEPDNVQALYLRGNIHRRVGALQKAVEDYRRAVELDPERHEVRWWLARVLLAIDRYQEAADHLEILRQRRRDDAEVLVHLAACRYHLGQGREARALLDAVLADHPDHGLALRTSGQMALMEGHLSEAEKWLRQAVRVMPYDYKANWFLGECLRKQDKKEEAEAQRVRTEKLDDRLTRKRELLTLLIPQKPYDPALQCELGTLLLQLGEPEVGESWLRNAVRLDKRYVPALEALADYYKQRGDADKAEEYRQRAQAAQVSKPPTLAAPK